MYCSSCGGKLQDGAEECPICGRIIEDNNSAEVGSVVQRDVSREKHLNKLKKEDKIENAVKKVFSSDGEKYITSLGNSYLQNFLFDGSLRKGFCVVSDKRVYFKGTTYTITTSNNGKKRARKYKSSRTIDLYDVTGTGCVKIVRGFSLAMAYILLVSMALLGVIPVIACIVALAAEAFKAIFAILLLLPIFLVLFLIIKWIDVLKNKSYVVIQYAGGEIAFDVKWFGKNEIDVFQKELRVAKDKAVEAKDIAMAGHLQKAFVNGNASEVSGQGSKADELTKYAVLLEKGLISEEEFLQIKKKMLDS